MTLDIFDRGDGRFDLMRGDAELGWISDRTIGFTGFEDAAAAHRAAAIAYDALTNWLARQRRIDAAPRNEGALSLRRNGAVAQLTLGDVPVGQLVQRGDDPAAGAEWAFELRLPPRVGAAVSAAHVMYLALVRHDVLRAGTPAALLA